MRWSEKRIVGMWFRVIGVGLLIGLVPIPVWGQATLTVAPSPARVGQSVTATLVVSSTAVAACSNVTLDWGDGTQVSLGAVPPHTKSAQHVYTQAGTYQIRARGVSCFSPNQTPADFTTSTTLVVQPPQPPPGQVQALVAQPAQVVVTQVVTFTVRGTGTCGLLNLDFGDGHATTLSGPFPLVAAHAYQRPGRFTARAVGVQNCTGTARASVAVTPPPPPTLTVSPTPAQVGVPVTVTLNLHPVYVCSSVELDFGDGTTADLGAVPAGTRTTTHVYRADRLFTVTAHGRCRPDDFSVQARVLVSRTLGGLSLRRVELRFANGRGEITVPKDFPDLRVYAEITYNGTGLFQATWEVDGRAIELVRRYLTFGGRVVLASPRPPVLPTFEPGLHRVTLRVDPSIPGPPIPTVFYLVTVEPQPALVLLVPEAGATLNERTSLFRWRYRDDVAQYLVEFFESDADAPFLRVLVTEPVYRLPPAHRRRFVAGRRYRWQVRALDGRSRVLATSERRDFVWSSEAGPAR